LLGGAYRFRGWGTCIGYGLPILHHSSNRRMTKGQESTMYNSVSAGIAGRGTAARDGSRLEGTCGCTVFWAWRSQARARAKQVAIACGCLQALFRYMHGSIGDGKLIASIRGAVIATSDADVAMMSWVVMTVFGEADFVGSASWRISRKARHVGGANFSNGKEQH
jgi:hypothetical protein